MTGFLTFGNLKNSTCPFRNLKCLILKCQKLFRNLVMAVIFEQIFARATHKRRSNLSVVIREGGDTNHKLC